MKYAIFLLYSSSLLCSQVLKILPPMFKTSQHFKFTVEYDDTLPAPDVGTDSPLRIKLATRPC